MAYQFSPIRSAAIAAAAVLLAAPALAQPPDATIDLTGRSVAVGVGYTWGGGTLHYRGMDYPLTVKGVSVIDIGVSKFTARGDVFHLNKPTDINGIYHALEAGAAVAGGGGVGTLENDKGVRIKLTTSAAGLQFKFAPEGVSIKLK
ncbi:MAG TPA: hypothetical protein VGN89_04100 [Phenylobacterium sp.]|nr:hypothetical protein [Phenylobacterium sp.]